MNRGLFLLMSTILNLPQILQKKSISQLLHEKLTAVCSKMVKTLNLFLPAIMAALASACGMA